MPDSILRRHDQILSHELAIADSLISRLIGLLGKDRLRDDEMLWIKRCNSIHTFFMKFPIDCIFLDSQMKVCALKANILPWRIVFPIWSARSVIELRAGQIAALNIKVGDELHVGH